jgi:hypothetical protein
MRLHQEKWWLFLFCLLTIGPQAVAAKDENRRPLTGREANLPALKIEDPVTFPAAAITGREEKNELSETTFTPKIRALNQDFRALKLIERNLDFTGSALGDLKTIPFQKPFRPAGLTSDEDNAPVKNDGFNWRGALTQSFLFLGLQHGYAVLGQSKTRRALKGPFWNDYVDSVKSLHGWDDGGRFFTNYIAHPMQGALTGFIYVQNSPQATRRQFGLNGAYLGSRMKAMLWSAAWSTQFEIGPISQASIGNVGEHYKQTWEDIVVTPTLGTAMLIAEDALDRFFIKNIERRTNNFYIKIFGRMIFNPTRNFANILRFKPPWYRDRPVAR